MPQTASKRNMRYASKSLFSDEPQTETFNGAGPASGAPARNIVGDQGVDKLKAQGRGVATPGEDQLTPNEMAAKKAKAKADMEAENADLVGRVKKAMGKRGGPLVQSNYE